MSAIDVTVPIYGNPTTASVRNNFAVAKSEIDALQAFQSGGPYLPIAGGTLTGLLTLSGAPTTALHAATKAYADTKLPLAGGTMTGLLVLSGPPTVALGAATKAYTDTAVSGAVSGAAATYLPLAGGTLTGPLVLTADPTAALHAATKQYVDAAAGSAAGAVQKSGDTMTGLLVLSGDPAVALGAATKQYADARLPLAGGTMTGPITLSGPPSSGLHATTKSYVDGAIAGAGAGTYLSLTGGTMTGPITLSGPPSINLHPATKAYADTADALRLLLAGGTMTGLLTLSGPPTSSLHAATKAYVDSASSGGGPYLPISGGTVTGALHVLSNFDAATVAAGVLFVQPGGGGGNPLTVSVSSTSTDPIQFSGGGSGGAVFNMPLKVVSDPTVALGVATKQYVDSHGSMWNAGTVTVVQPDQFAINSGTLSIVNGATLSATPTTAPVFINGGTDAPAVAVPGTTLLLQNDGTASARLTMLNVGVGAQLRNYTALGSFSALAPVGPATAMGGLQAFGHDGSAWGSAANAEIRLLANGVWSSTSHPTAMYFYGTPVGSTAPVLWMQLKEGRALLGVGAIDDGINTLQVNGGIVSTGELINQSGLAASALPALPTGRTNMLRIAGAAGASVEFLTDSIGGSIAYDGRRANGTPAAPTALIGGQSIQQFSAFGHDGTAYTATARGGYQLGVGSTWTGSNHHTTHLWNGTPAGAIAQATWMFLSNARLQIGAALTGLASDDGVNTLQITGSGRINNTNTAVPSLIVNGNTVAPAAALTDTVVQIVGQDEHDTRLVVESYGNSLGTPQFTTRNARGTSAAPSASQLGDVLFGFNAYGYGATGFSATSRVRLNGIADENWTNTAQGTRLSIILTPVGGTAQGEKFRFTGAGALMVNQNTDDGVHKLQITGSAKLTTGLGVWNVAAPTTKPAITGSRGTATVAVLTALLTALASYGLITDSTTA